MLKYRIKFIQEYIDSELREKRSTKINKIVEEIKRSGDVDSEIFWKMRKKIIGPRKEGRYAIEDRNGIIRDTEEEIKEVYKCFYDDLLNKRNQEVEVGEEEVLNLVNTVIKGMEQLSKRAEPLQTTENEIKKLSDL